MQVLFVNHEHSLNNQISVIAMFDWARPPPECQILSGCHIVVPLILANDQAVSFGLKETGLPTFCIQLKAIARRTICSSFSKEEKFFSTEDFSCGQQSSALTIGKRASKRLRFVASKGPQLVSSLWQRVEGSCGQKDQIAFVVPYHPGRRRRRSASRSSHV